MAVLITGATGYLGGLITIGLLTRSSHRLILPIRDKHSPESIRKNLKQELVEEGLPNPDPILERIILLPLEKLEDLKNHLQDFKEWNVREFIHCAACLDHLDIEGLQKINVDLTQELLTLCKELPLRRFIYLSTAFSSGYRNDLIREELHGEPESDPNFYTKTKRESEKLVAESGLPYLILRPSIVIGDSRDGKYWGRSYGIYQFMDACEKIVGTNWYPVGHLVAPKISQNMLHQNSFMEIFHVAYDNLPDGSILNMVADPQALPTVREGFTQWLELLTRPEEIYFYSNAQEIPNIEMPLRNKLLLEVSKFNVEILSRTWNFSNETIDQWIQQGFSFTKTTKESLRTCLEWRIQQSPVFQTFLKTNQKYFPKIMKIIDYTTGEVEERPLKEVPSRLLVRPKPKLVEVGLQGGENPSQDHRVVNQAKKE